MVRHNLVKSCGSILTVPMSIVFPLRLAFRFQGDQFHTPREQILGCSVNQSPRYNFRHSIYAEIPRKWAVKNISFFPRSLLL
jgi:hypothetical protein